MGHAIIYETSRPDSDYVDDSKYEFFKLFLWSILMQWRTVVARVEVASELEKYSLKSPLLQQEPVRLK
jgi:hypothetical protein